MKACDEIELQPGYKISSVDYYKNRYNIELRDPEQIMLLSIKVLSNLIDTKTKLWWAIML